MKLALGALLASALAAGAFVVDINSAGQPRRWKLDPPDPDVHTNVVNRATKAIRYYLASDAYSSTNAGAELDALRASFAQWQAIPGTMLKFEDAGLVAPGVDINTEDNTNVLFWAKTSVFINGCVDNIANLAGVTCSSSFSDNNALAEADIVLNGVQYPWFTDFNNTNATSQFIEGAATHEIGHFIGLQHSPVGGATMLWRAGNGVNLWSGLSADEVAAARWLYAPANPPPTLARLRGNVTMNGAAVFGAVVVAQEVGTGNMIAGSVTEANGVYDLPALPLGQYHVWATPLDPEAQNYLIRGRDIAAKFTTVMTAFVPGTNVIVTLTNAQTVTGNFTVTSGTPAFRITHIRSPVAASDLFYWSPLPASIRPGQSNLFIGVGSADLPTGGASLTISGDGLTVGAPDFQTMGGLNFISVPIGVASNATPGLRSFVVQHGTDLAYANGFLEILPPIPDYNFDGLDDRFQRQYFRLFTSAQAAPGADPDGDGFTNQAEYISGTNPNDSSSLLKIKSVTLDANGSTIIWQSGAGKRYQVWSRRDVANEPWEAVGPPVVGTDSLTQFTDISATNEFRFYRVQALP